MRALRRLLPCCALALALGACDTEVVELFPVDTDAGVATDAAATDVDAEPLEVSTLLRGGTVPRVEAAFPLSRGAPSYPR